MLFVYKSLDDVTGHCDVAVSSRGCHSTGSGSTPIGVKIFFFVISRTFESHCEGGLGHKRHNLGQTFANAKIAGVQITSRRFAMKEILFDFAAELFVCPILPCGDVSCFRSKVSSDV